MHRNGMAEDAGNVSGIVFGGSAWGLHAPCNRISEGGMTAGTESTPKAPNDVIARRVTHELDVERRCPLRATPVGC